jgi:hypothetical protein
MGPLLWGLEDAKGGRGVKDAFLKDAALCVGKITKQSQTTEVTLFPQCYISGYYCEEHIAFIHEGRDVEEPWEAI